MQPIKWICMVTISYIFTLFTCSVLRLKRQSVTHYGSLSSVQHRHAQEPGDMRDESCRFIWINGQLMSPALWRASVMVTVLHAQGDLIGLHLVFENWGFVFWPAGFGLLNIRWLFKKKSQHFSIKKSQHFSISGCLFFSLISWRNEMLIFPSWCF